MKKDFTRFLTICAVAGALCLPWACSDDDDKYLPDDDREMRTGTGTTDSVGETPILPKKQMRAVWIATVYGIDWPQATYNSVRQKRLYTNYLDRLVKMNINTVFFQVRPMADAFYDSPYEPWSQYITGTRGRKPIYDVLKFMIDEAHKRCISFHAWINPYRIAVDNSGNGNFPALDKKIPAELVKTYKKIQVYNPALPETRARLDSIVKDLIVKYDVDGIHMDDYFYPTTFVAGETMGDDAEFQKYGKGFSKIEDWRRQNVTLMVRSLQQVISDTRREVVFSISPQGNIENDYNGQYADVNKWMAQGWLDLMIPQIYYKTGTGYYDFNNRVAQWATNAKRCGLAVGYGIYRFDPASTTAGFKTNAMLSEQFRIADAKRKITGDVLYSMQWIVKNRCNIDSVLEARYAEKALVPFYGKYASIKPASPSNVMILKINNLTWDGVDGAYYAVYRSNGDKKVATLVGVTRDTSFELPEDGNYFVTAVNKKDNSESAISAIVRYNKQEQINGIRPITIR